MGKRSIKENKNIYFLTREEQGLTRLEASERTEGIITASRLEKIENEKIQPHPEDILALAKAYNKPSLIHHFCSHECAIGKIHRHDVHISSLSEIVLSTLSTLNTLNKEKDRLIEITEDGIISDDELEDFAMIANQLEKISITADALNLWVSDTIASGKIDKEKELSFFEPDFELDFYVDDNTRYIEYIIHFVTDGVLMGGEYRNIINEKYEEYIYTYLRYVTQELSDYDLEIRALIDKGILRY